MAPRPIEAVIFDFDGTLVRSIELHAVSYQLALRQLGVSATTLDVLLMEGARSETILRELLLRAGRTAEPELVRRLSAAKQRIYTEIGVPQPYPGAERVVAELHARGFPLALCSGTRKENVAKLAPAIVGHFRHLVTQEQYAHDKPHPEPYLTAARALSVVPERCLVVENAPRGIESAKAAGTFVVAVPQTLPAHYLTGADVVVATLTDALDVVPGRPGEAPTR